MKETESFDFCTVRPETVIVVIVTELSEDKSGFCIPFK